MQRYSKVQVLLLHWKSDDLFVLPELEDLEQCMREDYSFETDIFAIPSENSHLELMLKVGSLIKDHESTDTLFIVYYGGHARIDESRQSTWCATRHSGSPWLQWSAIQTLLERSVSDTLILLDCCAGAASATFPNGKSITETISASSWDAIAPDPGRYSFTNALIEVLQQWKVRTFSAAMLHAEVLARLKHPRPITINGKHFEARSTPVHFMMTSNHKAPSIELGRIVPENRRPPSPPDEPEATMPLPSAPISSGRGGSVEGAGTEPTEDRPHVMISLALEDNQQLDLDAWEQWLASFPALAKYVKVQGVFKSHSTLLLLSLPVMIWDLLPEDHACNFVAFIRSNNMIKPSAETNDTRIADNVSISGTTQAEDMIPEDLRAGPLVGGRHLPYDGQRTLTAAPRDYIRYIPSSLKGHGAQQPRDNTYEKISRNEIMNTSRSSKWTVYHPESVPEAPRFNSHIVARLEEYFNNDPEPSNAAIEYYASNLGAQTNDISVSCKIFTCWGNVDADKQPPSALVLSPPQERARFVQPEQAQTRCGTTATEGGSDTHDLARSSQQALGDLSIPGSLFRPATPYRLPEVPYPPRSQPACTSELFGALHHRNDRGCILGRDQPCKLFQVVFSKVCSYLRPRDRVFLGVSDCRGALRQIQEQRLDWQVLCPKGPLQGVLGLVRKVHSRCKDFNGRQ